MKLYKVGGCVRDKLLGLQCKDIDYSCVSSASNISEAWEELRSYLKDNDYEIFLETPSCLTIRAKKDKEVADFVLARKEVYSDNSRIPTVSVGTLYDDLSRRDFTVNALAEDENGNVIDHFQGMTDLKNKVLRCPLDPVTTFMDDPLRILRAIRFMITKEFKIELNTLNAFKNKEILKKFHTVSDERIREELYKMFKHNTKESLKILYRLDDMLDGEFFKIIFNNLNLKPTSEKL